jgi:hypothetical protein
MRDDPSQTDDIGVVVPMSRVAVVVIRMLTEMLALEEVELLEPR